MQSIDTAHDGTEHKTVAVGANLRGYVYRYGLVLVFLAVFALFSLVNPAIFPTANNLQLIASTQATVAFVALAVMVPIIVGQFDLSAGFQFGFAQGLCAVLALKLGFHPAIAILITLAVGMVIGLTNGLLITKLKLPSFTTTLGVGIVILGASQLVTGDQIIMGVTDRWFVDLGRAEVFGLPLPFVYLIVASATLWVVLRYTIWGRRCYAVGSNIAAAMLAGINADRMIIQAMVVGGLFNAIAGCISVMILGSSSPTIGLGTLLPAFAGVFLGATAFEPGRYNVAGTVLAVYLVGTGITGLQQLGAMSYVEQFFNGGALLLAIILASLAGRRNR